MIMKQFVFRLIVLCLVDACRVDASKDYLGRKRREEFCLDFDKQHKISVLFRDGWHAPMDEKQIVQLICPLVPTHGDYYLLPCQILVPPMSVECTIERAHTDTYRNDSYEDLEIYALPEGWRRIACKRHAEYTCRVKLFLEQPLKFTIKFIFKSRIDWDDFNRVKIFYREIFT